MIATPVANSGCGKEDKRGRLTDQPIISNANQSNSACLFESTLAPTTEVPKAEYIKLPVKSVIFDQFLRIGLASKVGMSVLEYGLSVCR